MICLVYLFYLQAYLMYIFEDYLLYINLQQNNLVLNDQFIYKHDNLHSKLLYNIRYEIHKKNVKHDLDEIRKMVNLNLDQFFVDFIAYELIFVLARIHQKETLKRLLLLIIYPFF